MKNTPKIAIKGLPGWHVKVLDSMGNQFSVGPYSDAELPKNVPLCIDMTPVYEKQDLGTSFAQIWRQPNLDLTLPDNNVRHLFEGCIGCDGTTQGHPWRGDLTVLSPMDSVGLTVYVEILKAAGGVVKHPKYQKTETPHQKTDNVKSST